MCWAGHLLCKHTSALCGGQTVNEDAVPSSSLTSNIYDIVSYYLTDDIYADPLLHKKLTIAAHQKGSRNFEILGCYMAIITVCIWF